MTAESIEARDRAPTREPAREQGGELAARVAALRGAFDRAFAAAPVSDGEVREDLLAIRVAEDAYALRLSELVGLFVDRRILALPSRAPGLLGVTGVRGAVLPVYSLAAALGYALPASPPRWLAVAAVGPDRQLGLAFEQFEGYLRSPRSQIGRASGASRSHVPETIHVGGQTRALVNIASVTAAIAQRAGGVGSGRGG